MIVPDQDVSRAAGRASPQPYLNTTEKKDMKISWLATLPLIGALTIAPNRATAQISVNLHLGKPVVVTNYAPETYGDWHTAYRHWSPTTVYYYNGNWYPRRVRGSRAVTVYRQNGHYFLPPQDEGWNRHDRRYNYSRRPSSDDYQHVAPAPPPPTTHARPRPRP
jgi:hypothetical protein